MKEAKPFVMDPKVMSMHKELSVKSRVRVKLPRSTRPLSHKLSKEIRWFILMLQAMCSNSNCGNLSVSKKEYG